MSSSRLHIYAAITFSPHDQPPRPPPPTVPLPVPLRWVTVSSDDKNSASTTMNEHDAGDDWLWLRPDIWHSIDWTDRTSVVCALSLKGMVEILGRAYIMIHNDVPGFRPQASGLGKASRRSGLKDSWASSAEMLGLFFLVRVEFKPFISAAFMNVLLSIQTYLPYYNSIFIEITSKWGVKIYRGAELESIELTAPWLTSTNTYIHLRLIPTSVAHLSNLLSWKC